MYPERLLDHFQNPRNVGELPPPAVTVEVSNPACGDIMRLSVRFENGRAVESRLLLIRRPIPARKSDRCCANGVGGS